MIHEQIQIVLPKPNQAHSFRLRGAQERQRGIAADDAEGCAAHRGIGSAEHDLIQDVERFRPELHGKPLTNRERLHHRLHVLPPRIPHWTH